MNKEKLLLPISIVVAGALIAGGIYLTNKQDKTAGTDKTKDTVLNQEIIINPVTEKDHIRGNADAEMIIVEYSDTECPFCKIYHETMKTIIDKYTKDNQVAWVYRHMPLDQLHKKARKQAEASECVAELGGNESFWKFLDNVYKTTNSNDSLDMSLLPNMAVSAGVDKEAFETCLTSGRFAEKVQADVDDAILAAKTSNSDLGTPFNVIIKKTGEKAAFSGALPLEMMEQIIQTVLTEGIPEQ